MRREEAIGQATSGGEMTSATPTISDRAVAVWEIVTIVVSVLVAEWVVLSDCLFPSHLVLCFVLI
jgi:hypothetical protein